ncbi:MAG: Transcriptional regulator, LuxR family protein [Massilia sp.]|nr:Transcriptional regulator, LuxR family protein [Massilia sp.]
MNARDKTGEPVDRLGPVINSLYDAALGDAGWQHIAAAIAAAFDSTSVVLKTYGGEAEPQLSSVTDNLRIPARDQAWADYWHANDLWVERSSRLPVGQVFTSQRLMPDAQFERTCFYQDWTRRLDIYHMVGVLFSMGDGKTGVLGVHRLRGAGAYGQADCRQLNALYPHVRRALGLRGRLQAGALARGAALAALACLETAVLVVDASRTVLYANDAAERLVAAGVVCIRARRLCVGDQGLNDRLACLVREAACTAAGEVHLPGAAMALPRAGRLPVTLLVSPWHATWAPAAIAQAAAMVFLRDPEASNPAGSATLRELFGLTPAEAAVAVAVGEGKSLEQIASMLSVGLGTVRTHVKKALAKTGTGRQGALAALVAHSVAGIARR